MPRKRAPRAPLAPRSLARGGPDGEPNQTYAGPIATNFFVSGEQPPQLKATLQPIAGAADGEGVRTYEVRVEVVGVHLGKRAFPPPMTGTRVVKTSPPGFHHPLTRPFRPPHLRLVLNPPPVPRPRRRPRRRRPGSFTTVFAPDDRAIFDTTAYPWSAFGRCLALNPFSGALVGPRHVLTCSHGINWSAPVGFDADWFTFTPDSYLGSAPFGMTHGVHVYYLRRVGEDPTELDDIQFDYAVVVLQDRIGEAAGWFGVRPYDNAWDDKPRWWHAGYPNASPYNGIRPTYEGEVALDGDNAHPDEHKAAYHFADTGLGHSGGPMFGYWEDEDGPRAVAVQSGGTPERNEASGGGDLVDLVIRARTEFP
jgi:V8-like Glu-specific endopeptidase